MNRIIPTLRGVLERGKLLELMEIVLSDYRPRTTSEILDGCKAGSMRGVQDALTKHLGLFIEVPPGSGKWTLADFHNRTIKAIKPLVELLALLHSKFWPGYVYDGAGRVLGKLTVGFAGGFGAENLTGKLCLIEDRTNNWRKHAGVYLKWDGGAWTSGGIDPRDVDTTVPPVEFWEERKKAGGTAVHFSVESIIQVRKRANE